MGGDILNKTYFAQCANLFLMKAKAVLSGQKNWKKKVKKDCFKKHEELFFLTHKNRNVSFSWPVYLHMTMNFSIIFHVWGFFPICELSIVNCMFFLLLQKIISNELWTKLSI